MPDAEQSIDDEAAAGDASESAGNLVRLIETALPHALERQRYWDDDTLVRGR